MRRLLACLVLVAPAVLAAGATGYATLPGGRFRSALDDGAGARGARIAPFALMRTPVSNAQFLAFVQAHPRWRRDTAPRTLAGSGYLSHWSGPAALGAASPQQPVTHVSWFAAQAYCQAQGARLPRWSEWEYAAAADDHRRDARDDPAWQARMLGGDTHRASLGRIGEQPANVYGVRDLHGLVAEWTDDASSLLVSDDARSSGDGDQTTYCGAGALSMANARDYAVTLRVQLLGSLQAQDSTAQLGFRCAKDIR